MKKNYEQIIETTISYLVMKVEERDWHAVSDAANDLRVLEAEKNCSGPMVLGPDRYELKTNCAVSER